MYFSAFLDFSAAHPEINVVNIAGSGANTVKIDLDDVLQSGINLFNDANGWSGTTTNSDHTYVVYHLDANNADGRSQVLVDQDMNVL